MTARRELTPVTVSRARNLRNGRREIWEAASTDGIWGYLREEGPGTPWVVLHRPTDRWYYMSSLPKARAATADGTALAYLDDTQPPTRN